VEHLTVTEEWGKCQRVHLLPKKGY